MNYKNQRVVGGLDDAKPIAGGFKQLNVGDTAASVADLLGATLSADCDYVLCQCKGASVMELVDGDSPTAAVGVERELSEKWIWNAAEVKVAQVISTSTASVINTQQYRK